MPWNDAFECMPPEKLRKFQMEKLRETVAWVQERVPFYRDRLEKIGLTAEALKDVEGIRRLPLTCKDDLREHYPFDLCAVPMERVVRVHASSGTTGKPITGPYTREDLELWTECMARALWSAGVRSSDVVQDAHGYGLFTGGFGFYQGATRIGAALIPTGSGATERQILIMRDFGSTVLCCTPSYALTIGERAEELGVDIRALPLRLGVFGAEPWSVGMRREIEQRMGIIAMEVYGLTEMGGPGTAFDCEAQNGLHINEDHFLPEVIDPATLEPLPHGEVGELVLTSLQRRAMPLIRYRTRDLTRLWREPCSCGRSLIRMEKVSGRTDDMLIISGVNVFPSQIESLLLDIPDLAPQYALTVRKKGYLDQLIIEVEAKREVYEAGAGERAALEKRIVAHIRGTIGITPQVRVVDWKSLARSEGKAKRVVDERPKEHG